MESKCYERECSSEEEREEAEEGRLSVTSSVCLDVKRRGREGVLEGREVEGYIWAPAILNFFLLAAWTSGRRKESEIRS